MFNDNFVTTTCHRQDRLKMNRRSMRFFEIKTLNLTSK